MSNDPDAIPIFDEDGALTREFLLQRGYCCENGCRNCPYGFKKAKSTGDSANGTRITGRWKPKSTDSTTP